MLSKVLKTLFASEKTFQLIREMSVGPALESHPHQEFEELQMNKIGLQASGFAVCRVCAKQQRLWSHLELRPASIQAWDLRITEAPNPGRFHSPLKRPQHLPITQSRPELNRASGLGGPSFGFVFIAVFRSIKCQDRLLKTGPILVWALINQLPKQQSPGPQTLPGVHHPGVPLRWRPPLGRSAGCPNLGSGALWGSVRGRYSQPANSTTASQEVVPRLSSVAASRVG